MQLEEREGEKECYVKDLAQSPVPHCRTQPVAGTMTETGIETEAVMEMEMMSDLDSGTL